MSLSEQMKFIVQELNKEPFNKSYNLISFDSLEPLQLLQVLNDVLAIIDPKQKMDIREEAPDQTAVRIFQVLRVLKYKPPDHVNMSQFRAGIVQGEKPILFPILEWLLQKVPELQKRAYLAKFLVKIEVPAEIMQDEEVNGIYMQYEELMEQFKELHKQFDQLKNSGFSTSEIRKDIANMEEEKEQLIKRIERLRRKVESHPNSTKMMTVAKNLRIERDREKKLAVQKQEQQTTITHLEQRIKRLEAQLRDMRQASIGATPSSMIQKLEEETRTNGFIVKEQLPKDITQKKKMIQNLQKVVSVQAMGNDDLLELNSKISELNAEVNQLIEKRMRSGEPADDKLSLFRQQAGIIAHKKLGAAETLRSIRDEFNHIQRELEQKRDVVSTAEGAEVLKGEDFKRYVNKLRSKSTVYKKKRAELAELRAEAGVLSRTEEILKQRNELINRQLSVLEKKKGVAGYRETQEELEKVSSMKSELDEMKGRTLDDMSEMVRRLHAEIADRRNTLAPILREIRPLREKVRELNPEYESKKQVYERQQAGFDSNMSKLQQEVKGYKEECRAEESRYHYLNCMMKILQVQQARVASEMKAYVSADAQEKKKTFREVYSKKIQEQENLSRGLRERQKTVRENHEPNMKQMKMWKDLERLLECKKQCLDQLSSIGASTGANLMMGGYGESAPTLLEDDRLVL
ncbi:intraflagellar transport protein 81 homolog [Physella acuta]|uniref:intraflagellar transport protein 81 homolog n=1 Tax=Physella acuta TaxID=109671 RepID=UPI0027DE84C2|nr:intraflagellar transport protein 81 homolog [Physella acuta]XP_059177447.1 intraflagellar transport protein 81 homolog [Physella acuta]